MSAKNQMAAKAEEKEDLVRKETARNKDKSRRTFLDLAKTFFSNSFVQIALYLILLGSAQKCGIEIPNNVPGITTTQLAVEPKKIPESPAPKIPDIS